MKNNERQKHLNSIRKKLSFFIKQNKKLNLRDLSRKLKKNDAYLQQYISRGSPSFLPEEERKMLSDIVKLDINFCLLYTSPSPRDGSISRMPSSA